MNLLKLAVCILLMFCFVSCSVSKKNESRDSLRGEYRYDFSDARFRIGWI